LIHEAKREFDYEPEKALALWNLLEANGFIPEEYIYDRTGKPYAETDEERITALFEITDDCLLAGVVFWDTTNYSQGSELIERGEDE
jgi:hypothetical protein